MISRGEVQVGAGAYLPYDTAPAPRSLALLSPLIQSMTGYAAAVAASPRGELALEMRSVNSRFLDIQFRVVEELRALESMLRERISARLGRGKIDCRLYFAGTAGSVDRQSADPTALQNLARLAAEAK